MSDPDLLKEAEKQKLEVSLVTGQQVESLIRNLMSTPPDFVDKLNKLAQGK